MATSSASSRAAPGGPGRSPADDARDRLITATTECLKKFGIAKTGVIDIVRESGQSRQTAYRYFSGRRELIYNAFLRASAKLLEGIPKAVEGLTDPTDVLVESILFLLRELPRDEVLSQAFGPGALASLQPIGTDQAATAALARASLVSYRKAVGTVSREEMRLLSEHLNRIVLSAMLLADGDTLLRADDEARTKLRSWFGPTVERHAALQTVTKPRSRRR